MALLPTASWPASVAKPESFSSPPPPARDAALEYSESLLELAHLRAEQVFSLGLSFPLVRPAVVGVGGAPVVSPQVCWDSGVTHSL